MVYRLILDENVEHEVLHRLDNYGHDSFRMSDVTMVVVGDRVRGVRILYQRGISRWGFRSGRTRVQGVFYPAPLMWSITTFILMLYITAYVDDRRRCDGP